MKNRLRNALGQRAGKTAGLFNRAGFTLLELLVVVGILAALVALALPFYQDYVNQSKTTAAQADLLTFKKALAANDQLEPTVYTSTDLRGLIGKYLQDYRKLNLNNPIDPWGSEYDVRISDGTLISRGPNRISDTALGTSTPAVDDLVETWKPPFTLSSARAINATTVEIIFTRKIGAVNPANNFISSITNGTASNGVVRVSDTIFRFSLVAPGMTGASQVRTVTTLNTVTAQDLTASLHATKADGSAGNVSTLTY